MCSPNSIRSRSRLALLGAVCVTIASPAFAQDAALPFSTLGEAMADSELADMRGKFVRQHDVSFFGISLLTSWQDAQGVTTNARLVFNVDFLNLGSDGNPVPTLMIGWVRDGDPDMDVTDIHSGYVPLNGSDSSLTIGGIASHQGAAQANVIAGSGNSARNNMQIAIVPASAIPDQSVAGLQAVNGTSEFAFVDGDQLKFQVAGNRLGIVMTGAQGLDSSLQSLGGDAGQVLQQTMLNTDGNSIFNSASIVLATDTFAQAERLSLDNALSAMKGHGF